jgi:hypothetical protein
MIYDWDISSFFCNEGPSSKTNKSLLYRCEEEGCCKSYSNRQNLRRHKLKEHVESMMAKLAAKSDECLRRQQADAAQREQELLIETFSSFYEQFGEEQASIAIKNNGKLKDHLIPLRKIMEDNLAAHSANAQESQSVVEKHLAQFRAISTESVDELNAFDAVINLVKEATPEKVARLKQFCQVITAFTNHVADHSESANPKIKHARAFKKILDGMFIDAQNGINFPPSNALKGASGKKKAAELAAAAGPRDSCAKKCKITVCPAGSGKHPAPVGEVQKVVLGGSREVSCAPIATRLAAAPEGVV